MMRETNLRCRAAAWLVMVVVASAQTPGTEWTSGMGVAGTFGEIRAMIEFDDGTGPALFVGGSDLFRAGDQAATQFARWKDGRWSSDGAAALGANLSGFATFDDGAGVALYAVGAPSPLDGRGLFRWSGGSWVGVGAALTQNGNPQGAARLVAFDDGGGAKLYVTGAFDAAGALTGLPGIAAFDGANWSAVGGSSAWGAPGAMCVAVPGGVPTLFAAWGASIRTYASGSWANTPLGALTRQSTGNPNLVGKIHALAAIVESGVSRVYAGGDFTHQAGVFCGPLLRFDGAQWALPWQGPPASLSTVPPVVKSLLARHVAGVDELVFAGVFDYAGPVAANQVARLTTAGHVALPSSLPLEAAGGALALVHEEGVEMIAVDAVAARPGPNSPSVLHRPGLFDGVRWRGADRRSTPVPYGNVASFGAPGAEVAWLAGDGEFRRRDGATWTAAAPLPGPQSTGGVLAQIGRDFEQQTFSGVTRKFAAGRFFASPTAADPEAVVEIVGGAAVPVGAGLKAQPIGQAFALAAGSFGLGARLYVGGTAMTLPNGSSVSVAQWTGTAWQGLGTGIVGSVQALAVWNEGNGPDLYAGGQIVSAGGVAMANIAKWNGFAWIPVGNHLNAGVTSLVVFDDGTGPKLYAGGAFTASAGTPALGVARFDGTAWTQVGQGLPGNTFNPQIPGVKTLAVYDDGTGAGPRLYAGGDFGTTYPSGLAVLDGGVWTGVPGLSGQPLNAASVIVTNLAAARDYDRPALYVQGFFSVAGGRYCPGTARLAPIAPQADWSHESGGVVFALEGLFPGRTYLNVFSAEGAGTAVGLGPYFGLYAADPNVLIGQLFLPPETLPFKFAATATDFSFGPVALPPGLVIDVVSADLGPGGPIVFSPAARVVTP
jgi:hypothetical protein